MSIAYHVVVGFFFVGFVVVHLMQRRHAVTQMLRQLGRARLFVERRSALALSDLLLTFLALNVLVSGVVDWHRGEPTSLPFPKPFSRWHLVSGLLLLLYLVAHVWRRRKRLWRSTIR